MNKGEPVMSWLVPAIVIIAFVALTYLLRGMQASPEPPAIPSFTPNSINDKVIFVKGWDEVEIRQIINDFIEQDKDVLYPAYTIEPHQQGEHLYRLTFPQDIHPWLFAFLINYLVYPFDLDLETRVILVVGKATLNSEFEGIDSSLLGQKAILYVPEDDEDYDVVYMQAESGINFARSFNEMKWRKVNEARLSNEVKNLSETSSTSGDG
jgi:hypothetical protein